jgi:hypothetical protein
MTTMAADVRRCADVRGMGVETPQCAHTRQSLRTICWHERQMP